MAKEPRPKSRFRGLKIFLIIQAVLVLLVLGGVTYYYVGGYAAQLDYLKKEALRYVWNAKESTFRSIETSVAYDSDGNVLSIMKGAKDVYYLAYTDIPVYVKEAIISIEDKKFYDHEGVDISGIVRAAWAMFRNGKITQGASTITQQLCRTIFLTNDRTWERKIEEIFMAMELEKRYSKNQILEYYLNNIYFGNGHYGIEAASRGYFNCGVKDLSLSQIAYLCAIPNSPTAYDPVKNPTAALGRRDRILTNMYDDGIISKEELMDALSERIVLNVPKKERHDYQETYTFYCATKALMKLEGFYFRYQFLNEEDRQAYQEEYTALYEECNAKLYQNGYRIYTSLDSTMQESLQESLNKELAINEEVNDEGIYALQGSAVCIDNDTGMVKAIVGGRGQEYDGYTLNRAYQSYRQPGSCIKPLIVYAPALEREYTPSTTVVDAPIPDGPSNAGGGYSGSMTLRRAVELSKNTIAWKIMEELTPKVGLSYLYNMNFNGLEPTDDTPAISLGGFTRGVSALELAEGFSTLENNGYFREATCILKITDSLGNIIYEPEMVPVSVYKEKAAKEMTDILRGVLFSPGATGRGLGLPNMDCAGKTGTTNDNKDGWFAGYTPYYTTAVWVGFDNPKELSGLWGSTLPGRVWKEFMTGIHEELVPRELNTAVAEEEDPENILVPIEITHGEEAPEDQEAQENEYNQETQIPGGIFNPEDWIVPNNGENGGGIIQDNTVPATPGVVDPTEYPAVPQDPLINPGGNIFYIE